MGIEILRCSLHQRYHQRVCVLHCWYVTITHTTNTSLTLFVDFQVNSIEDLNRQVVKSNHCTITIPEVGLEIPPEAQAGSLSTIEGILMKTTCALHESNERRKLLGGDVDTINKV